MLNAISTSVGTVVSSGVSTPTNAIKQVDDPLINGPFGDIRGLAAGSDVNNSLYVKGYSSDYLPIAVNNKDAALAWMLKHQPLGYTLAMEVGLQEMQLIKI